VPKLVPQHQMKPTHHMKEERANIDEKIEYARSVFVNPRRPHIKMALVTRVVTRKIQERTQMAKSSSSSPRATLTKRKSKASTTLTMFLMLMLLMFLTDLIINLMHPMFL
jgi:hypothetical protein